MSSSSPVPRDVEVVKWYTRARRFPKLIGKTHDGTTIWGGPYTHTQVGAFAAIWVLGSQTTELWARFGLVTNVLVLAGVSIGVVVLLGRLPVGSRNPLWVISGAVRAASGPPTGRYAGRAVRIARPHRVRSRLVVGDPSRLVHSAPEEPPASDVNDPAPTAASHAPAAMSGVQALLASHTTPKGD